MKKKEKDKNFIYRIQQDHKFNNINNILPFLES